MGVSTQKKWLLIIKPGPTAWLYVTITLMQQKHVDARFFFFRYVFGDLAQLKLLPSEHFPKKSMVFPGSKCYAEKQKKEEHGMGFKALVGYCCLSPGQPPGASKMSRHFGGLFPITNELLSANKQQTKTQALVANDGSLGSQGRCPV